MQEIAPIRQLVQSKTIEMAFISQHRFMSGITMEAVYLRVMGTIIGNRVESEDFSNLLGQLRIGGKEEEKRTPPQEVIRVYRQLLTMLIEFDCRLQGPEGKELGCKLKY